jgi:hypothetical protein
MPRRLWPADQEREETSARSGPSTEADEVTASVGSPAGIPRYLVERAAAAAAVADLDEAEDGATSGIDRAGEVGDSAPAAVADVSGTGVETEVSAYSVTLQGRTDATFSNSFRTRNVRTRRAEGTCENCTGDDCVRVTGRLQSTFRVTTTVTLPSVNDFPDLTACQRRRVQSGITNVLAPHEQQHVRAFRTYNGVVTTPFDLTICRSDFDSRIQELHDSVESARRASAQAASDALDPFQFDVDLDCED